MKTSEQKLHEEFERLRRQNMEEKRELETHKSQLVSFWSFLFSILTITHSISIIIIIIIIIVVVVVVVMLLLSLIV